MKIISVFLVSSVLILAGLSNLAAQDAAKPEDAAKAPASGIEWTSTTVDFGKIEQGKPVSAQFEFKNPTMVPLLISSVRPTCGCTIADYPKEPILPGKSGKIAVTYNAAAGGVFTKAIVVTSNATEGNTSLIIKGEVVPKKQ
jgi:hypothetical protein